MMSETYVQKILIAAAVAIDAPEKPAGTVVITSRSQPSAASRLITVFPLQDKPVENERQPRTRAGSHRYLTIAVVCRSPGTDIDNEELRAWAAARLLGNPTLDGAAVNIIETITDWQGELDSQNTYSMAVMQFLVEYARPVNSLERIPL